MLGSVAGAMAVRVAGHDQERSVRTVDLMVKDVVVSEVSPRDNRAWGKPAPLPLVNQGMIKVPPSIAHNEGDGACIATGAVASDKMSAAQDITRLEECSGVL